MTIHKSIRVERPPATAFKVFCEEIGQWWPKGPSFGGKDLADLRIEARVGGRFYERYVDDTEYDIGQVTAYQPPGRVAFTWRAELGGRDAGRSAIHRGRRRAACGAGAQRLGPRREAPRHAQGI